MTTCTRLLGGGIILINFGAIVSAWGTFRRWLEYRSAVFFVDIDCILRSIMQFRL